MKLTHCNATNTLSIHTVPFNRTGRRNGVLATLLLGLLWATFPASADEEPLPAEYRPFVQRFIDAAEAKDHQVLVNGVVAQIDAA